MDTTRNKLETTPVGKLLFSLAIPTIVAKLVSLLYNIVDRIFIGRIPNGEIAMAGIGITFPIILILVAFCGLFGMGGAPLCAIQLGKKDIDKAERITSTSFILLVGAGVLLTILLFSFQDDILCLFGASQETLPYARSYLSIYLLGTVFVQIAIGMNPFIITQGFAQVGMTTILIGAIINIVLDPLFIFGFDMGVSGAAWATILAQCVSAIWVLVFLTGKQSIVHIKRRYLLPSLKVVKSIVFLGISPFVMQSTECLVMIALNTQLGKYGGDLPISALAIMTGIMQMIVMPLQGLAQGMQPIVSYNYGAQRLDRLRKAIQLAFTYGMAFTFVCTSAVIFFPKYFVLIFSNHPDLVETTSAFLPIYFAGIYLFAAQVISQNIFWALGQAKISIFLALLRKIVLLLPLAYLLPPLFNSPLKGVIWAEPIADLTAATITVLLFWHFYRKKLKNTSSVQ